MHLVIDPSHSVIFERRGGLNLGSFLPASDYLPVGDQKGKTNFPFSSC